jgi:hypothetical protein
VTWLTVALSDTKIAYAREKAALFFLTGASSTGADSMTTGFGRRTTLETS